MGVPVKICPSINLDQMAIVGVLRSGKNMEKALWTVQAVQERLLEAEEAHTGVAGVEVSCRETDGQLRSGVMEGARGGQRPQRGNQTDL